MPTEFISGRSGLSGPRNRLRSLKSGEGARLMADLEKEADLSSAPLVMRLRSKWDSELVAMALQQETLRRKAAGKYTRASEMFFTKEGLEQASAEVVARHRAEQFAARADGHVLDLCCGVGGDSVFLAAHRLVIGIDADADRVACAWLNAEAYGVAEKARFVVADVQKIQIGDRRSVFIDPSRREDGRRRGLGWYQPSLDWCLELAGRAATVVIKAAPGIERDLVPEDWGLEFVAVGRSLKEAVLWSPSAGAPRRMASVLPGDAQLIACPGERIEVASPGQYLMDPSPAVTRAGLVEDLARILHAWKIDSQIAFLTSDTRVPTPFGRWLRIEESLPWNINNLRKVLRARDVGQVDIRRRGLAGDTGQIARNLNLHGKVKATLVMTRVEERPWAFVCVDA
jgi:hypothetical protein